ncbi:putative amidoligase domain-containing protein [Cohnella terricola]|uniref:PhiEco32-like amidoligase-type 2 protein n=1 Tax=Cohnella terricola TaxID=1289167 RepID=A0A559JR21_9BACL|nr:hypothetical protein [Cohnella terricola]TVY02318.1 hypothetical protein FPZ45_07745 [Cohnella terricola]
MNRQPGELKLHMGKAGGSRSICRSGMEKAGVPVLADLSDACSNDCVILVGRPNKRAGVTSPSKERGVLASEDSGSCAALTISPWLMNNIAPLVRQLPASELERRLRREGLPARIGDPVRGIDNTIITVAVWGFDAVEMRRILAESAGLNGIRVPGKDLNPSVIPYGHGLWKPAERLSVRAIYALGLDFGQVELTLSGEGRLGITSISSELNVQTPEGERRLKELLVAFSTEWEQETGRDDMKVTLGADPEFVLTSATGRLVQASKFFPLGGETGCDSIRFRGEKYWPLVELRPRPFAEPGRLAADLRRLLNVASGYTAGAKLSWRAGAMPVQGVPLGGHVHISGIALHGERVRALDNAVALPLRLLEPAVAKRRRPRYGALGDVRRQPHGGFEYRTPPSWLVSPRLALGTFALAKVAAEHSRELASDGRPLDDDAVRDAFYDGNRDILLPAVEQMYRTLSATSGYAAHKEAIDFVFDAIMRGRSWDESADIRIKWRIPIV